MEGESGSAVTTVAGLQPQGVVELWGAAEVSVRSHGPKRFRHPLIGVITSHQQRFVLPGGSGQELTTLTAEPGSIGEDSPRLLGTLDTPVGASVS